MCLLKSLQYHQKEKIWYFKIQLHGTFLERNECFVRAIIYLNKIKNFESLSHDFSGKHVYPQLPYNWSFIHTYEPYKVTLYPLVE
jgi:hypothetical protein